jgi:hypothetical protein
MKEWMHLLFFLAICATAYWVTMSLHYSPMLMEGMTTKGSNNGADSNNGAGVAGNAAAYSAAIKASAIKLQDTFLISKYRSDYESAILNLDDWLSNLMLQTTLSIDTSKPMEAVDKLAKLHQAKSALNTVMKFVDSN